MSFFVQNVVRGVLGWLASTVMPADGQQAIVRNVVGAAKGRGYANADEIATFLSTANPTSWPLETMKSEMRMHLDATLEEATAHLKGDWTGSAAAYDRVHAHILTLADTLSTGLLRAKPDAAKPSALPRTGAADTVGRSLSLAPLLGGILIALGVQARRRAGRTSSS